MCVLEVDGFASVRNIRFACVLQWGKTVAGVELPRGLNTEYIMLISEKIGNYKARYLKCNNARPDPQATFIFPGEELTLSIDTST